MMGNNHYVLANDMIIGYSWLMVTNHLVYHYHRIITIIITIIRTIIINIIINIVITITTPDV